MSKPSKYQSQSWYQPSWNYEDDKNDAANKKDGAIASKAIPTNIYIKSSRRNLLENHQDILEELSDNFPVIRVVKGDGLCALHASLAGIFAKCVDDEDTFNKFKNNLKKWSDGLNGENKIEAKKTVKEILARLNQENLTYKDFYNLTSETSGEDNLVNKLSVLLFTNTSFKANPKTGYPGSLKDQEQQKKYLSDPKTIDRRSGINMNSVMEMLIPILPFPIESNSPPIIIVDKNGIDAKLTKNSICLFYDGGHFDLLHSKLDRNLAKAVEVEKRIIKAEQEEILKKEKLIEKNLTAKENSPKYAIKQNFDVENSGLVFEESKNLNKSDVQQPKSILKNAAFLTQEVPEILNSNPIQKTTKTSNSELPNKLNRQNYQRQNLENLKTEFEIQNFDLPKTKEAKTFAKLTTQKDIDVKNRLGRYGFTVDSKTEALIKKENENQDKVFANKFVRALNKLRNIIQDAKSDIEEDEIWSSLTTLDKRVLIDYYNNSVVEGKPVKFESLEKSDLNKVLLLAVAEIPESSIAGSDAKTLHENIIMRGLSDTNSSLVKGRAR